jgi:hypothetical protein
MRRAVDRDIAASKAKTGADAFEFAYHAGLGLTLNEVVAFAYCTKICPGGIKLIYGYKFQAVFQSLYRNQIKL